MRVLMLVHGELYVQSTIFIIAITIYNRKWTFASFSLPTLDAAHILRLKTSP